MQDETATQPADVGATAPPESPPETAAPTDDTALEEVRPEAEEAPPSPEPAAEPSPKPGDKPVEGEKPPVEEKPPEAPKPEEAAKPPEEKPFTPEEEKVVTPELREAFQKNPQLRGAFFRDRQYGELFQTPDNARHVLETYQASAEDTRRFNSGSPDETRQLLTDWAQDFPQGYDRVVGMALNDAHKQYVAELERTGRTDLADSLKEIGRLFLGDGQASRQAAGQGQADARSAQLDQRESQLREERTGYENKQRLDFLNNVQGTWEKEVDGRISEVLGQLKPSGLGEWAEGNLRRNVITRLNETLNSDRIFGSRFRSLVDGGDRSDTHRKDVVKALGGRLSSLVDEFVTQELGNATRQVVDKAAEKKLEQEKREARREPGAGGTAAKPAARSVEDMQRQKGETEDHYEDRLLESSMGGGL
ncbi:hypothetical protein LCGC14_2228520 [marine sediment metagenome]|uniref:Uncharacterized protein n=1 Tax=marine sediment metagenome TaxID=412755 RepID=A0A0F9FLF8_9ZZZZ